MPAPLSHDLRRRIVEAYLAGEGTLDEMAERFQVGSATVTRLLRLYRQTGALAPKPHGGGTEPRVRPEDLPLLQTWLQENPSLTQAELAAHYAAHTGRSTSQRSISRTLIRHGITRKKTARGRTARPSGRSRRTGRLPTSDAPPRWR